MVALPHGRLRGAAAPPDPVRGGRGHPPHRQAHPRPRGQGPRFGELRRPRRHRAGEGAGGGGAGGRQRSARGGGDPPHAPGHRAHERGGGVRLRAADRDVGDGVGRFEGRPQGLRREARPELPAEVGGVVDARTPVLVGVGVAHQREDDPATADEAVRLMTTAVQRAGEDAHAPALLAQAGGVLVPRGSWRYRDPGRIVAEHFGANARTVIAELGVLQSTPFTRACRAIASGDLDVAIVVGGEAKFRDLRSHITGTAVVDTAQSDDVAPDESIKPADEIIPAPERAAGFMSAPLMYSAVETALRTALGETVPENARATAELWAAFSRTAAANPDAWRREPVAPEFLEHPSAKNPMLAAPYTKLHCSQWNVDQAAAFVLCSSEGADRAGVPQDQRVYPLAFAESNHMLAVSKRAELHRAPAVRIGAERIADRTGIDVAASDVVDLYSCFPVAVRVQARALGLRIDHPGGPALRVGGGMTFGGGPLNNATFQALARMVPMLREEPGTTG